MTPGHQARLGRAPPSGEITRSMTLRHPFLFEI